MAKKTSTTRARRDAAKVSAIDGDGNVTATLEDGVTSAPVTDPTPEVDPAAIAGKPSKITALPAKFEKRELPVLLRDEELRGVLRDIAKARSELDNLVSEREASNEVYKARIKEAESERDHVEREAFSGYRESEVECEWRYNVKTRKMELHRLDKPRFRGDKPVIVEERAPTSADFHGGSAPDGEQGELFTYQDFVAGRNPGDPRPAPIEAIDGDKAAKAAKRERDPEKLEPASNGARKLRLTRTEVDAINDAETARSRGQDGGEIRFTANPEDGLTFRNGATLADVIATIDGAASNESDMGARRALNRVLGKLRKAALPEASA